MNQVADDIYCVDTGLYRPSLAACYLLRSGQRLAVIDTGTARGVPRVLEAIAALGLAPENVEAVIPTHVHLDHAGAAGALLEVCANARLVVHPKGAPHLIDPSRLLAGATAVYGEQEFAKHFGDMPPIAESRVEVAADGHRIDLGGRVLRFIETPGHANHHGCLFDERTRGWFTGDTFGIAYPEFHTAEGPWLFAPTTPVAFDPPAWHASLDRLLAAQPKMMFLTHFGRVDAPARVAPQVRASIDALAELALRDEADCGADGRLARLKRAVADALTEAAQAHGVALASADIVKLLSIDIELNAQGLDVWLQRRAKQREAAAGSN